MVWLLTFHMEEDMEYTMYVEKLVIFGFIILNISFWISIKLCLKLVREKRRLQKIIARLYSSDTEKLSSGDLKEIQMIVEKSQRKRK